MDTLRGLFLVVMTLTHLPSHSLDPFTSYAFGFASAPDGFVFLSGLVSSWVYLNARQKHGQKSIERKALRRLRDIYLTHVTLLVTAIAGAVLLSGTSFRALHPTKAFIAGCLFLYQPPNCDILPMYCFFLLFLPLALDQMSKGRACWVGGLSFLLWLVAQRGIGDATYVVPWIDTGAFNLLAWQAYFVAGLYIGYRGVNGKRPLLPRSPRLLALCIVVATGLFLQRHFEVVTGIRLLRFHLNPNHNPIRFLDAACLGYILWYLPRSLDAWLSKLRLFAFFDYLGQHSLQVFSWSLLITYPMVRLHSYFWNGLTGPVRTALALLVVASLAIPARFHEMYRERRSAEAKFARRMEFATSMK